ncbi:hypothetical protein J4233_01275 [Candidatus Pacearchaeota archaeon]|nr:hypothetical protein [Candidatus Pacearchaeota archaeon]
MQNKRGQINNSVEKPELFARNNLACLAASHEEYRETSSVNCKSKLSGRASALRERISKQPERDRELGGCKQFQNIFNKGQISTEYLIVISFVLFIVLTALGIALTYSSQIKDTMKFNQIESFSQKIVSQSETVFYSGYPARTTVKAYLPDGINEIRIMDYYIVFNVSTSSGNSVTAYKSNVNLTGNIRTTSGLRVIYLNATSNAVVLSD